MPTQKIKCQVCNPPTIIPKIARLISEAHCFQLEQAGFQATFNEGNPWDVFSPAPGVSITWIDHLEDGYREYTLTKGNGSAAWSALASMLRKKYRIDQVETLGELWYEVLEWRWYFPFWTCWGIHEYRVRRPTRYKELYLAEQAIEARRKNAPHLSRRTIRRL